MEQTGVKRQSEDLDEPASKKGKTENGGSDHDDETSKENGGKSEKQADKCGTMVFCGATNWDLTGRKDVPKGTKATGGRNLWEPHLIHALNEIRVKTVTSGCTACHSIIITSEGQAMSWGRNEQGQLGHGDQTRRNSPEIITALESLNCIAAAVGKAHSLILTDDGAVYGFGDNTHGQLGLGSQGKPVKTPCKIKYSGPTLKRVACGAQFSMFSDVRGNLYSCGFPEYGQLGHNTDGSFFQKANKLDHHCELRPRKVIVFVEKDQKGNSSPVQDVEIDQIACGVNHTIAVDKKGRVFTWGFGGYGRLGHNNTANEMVPRHLSCFATPRYMGAKKVACGSSYTLAVGGTGILYLWGQQKSTGEANMYPKPVTDLSGWEVRSLGTSNRSIVLAADDGVVSWGPSPTYGELGSGEMKKSSTKPMEPRGFNDLYVHDVTCGYGHTLAIVKDDTPENKAALAALPVYNPDDQL